MHRNNEYNVVLSSYTYSTSKLVSSLNIKFYDKNIFSKIDKWEKASCMLEYKNAIAS